MRNTTTQRARRRFLGQLGALAGAAARPVLRHPAAALGTLGTLNLSRIAAAAEVPGDYKAMICIFLYGGSDSYNCVVPYDADGHASYAAARQTLAVPREVIMDAGLDAGIDPALGLIDLRLPDPGYPRLPQRPDTRLFGLNPSMACLKPIYDAGRLAVTLGVGTLVEPTTKAQYRSRSVRIPPSIGSHSDQQFQTQTCGIFDADMGYTGLFGRLGDYFFGSNVGLSTFTNVSLSGDNVIQVGEQAMPYSVNTSGQVDVPVSRFVNGGLQGRLDAGRRALLFGTPHVFDGAYSETKARSLEGNQALAEALAGAEPVAGFPPGRLGGQLEAIARIISVASQIGISRQTFFASMGGFDTHSNQNDRHPQLINALANGLAALDAWAQSNGLGDKVTTFTASDFARTHGMNGNDGTDHAWSGVQFVQGGAVQGGLYGAMPDHSLGGPDDISNHGRFIPSIAVDQVAATLAGWYGVPSDALSMICPNIDNFDGADLGFMG
jgi:uncharacterized protein (DUF1501 family)